MIPRREREKNARDLIDQIQMKQKYKNQDYEFKNEDFMDKQKRVYNYAYERPVTLTKQQQTLQESMKTKNSAFARISQRKTHEDNSRYNTYTSKVSYDHHPNRDYALSHQTNSTKFEEKMKFAESLINQDYQKGPQVVEQELNQMVNSYKKPNMFADSKRQKFLPVHYRDGYLENANKILNNNTTLRIFGRNNPARPDVKPDLGQNIAGPGIRPKDWLTTYEADNPGILKRTKSMHFRKFQTQQSSNPPQDQKFLSQSQSQQVLLQPQAKQSQQQFLFQPQAVSYMQQSPSQSLLLPSQKETNNNIRYFQPSPQDQTSSQRELNPLKYSGTSQVAQKLDEKQPDNYYRSGKIGNSFNEIESRKKALDRMINNETRSHMLANEYISNYNPMASVNASRNQEQWNKASSIVVNTIPDPIIKSNQFYQIDQVYQTSKANNDKPELGGNPPIYSQSPTRNQINDYGMMSNHQKNNSMIEVPKWNNEKFSSYRGLDQFGSMQQPHPAILQKPQFKDMLALSQTLDRNISMTMRQSGSNGKVLFF